MANDPTAPLVELAEAVKAAQQIVADAKAKMDAAKMAQIKANDDLSAAKARAEALDKAEAALRARELALQESQGQHQDNVAQHNLAARELLQRQRELAANEARVADALEAARKSEAQAKTYEGHAYEILEAKRKALAQAESIHV